MKYANQLNLVLALIGAAVLVYTFAATFFSPAPSITIDPVRLRELGSAGAGMATDAGVVFQLEGTTQTAPLDQTRQRRDLQQVPRSAEVETRPGSGLVMPAPFGPSRSPAGRGGVANRRTNPPQRSVGGPGRVTPVPPRSTTRVVESGIRVPQVESSASTLPESGDGQQRTGLVGSGGGTPPPGAPPPRVVQPRPGAENEKRNEPTQPPPPPFRSSMPAGRPPE